MHKFKILYYQKPNSWYVNGGKLIVTENQCIVKYLFLTIAKFQIDKTAASKIPSSASLFGQGIRLNDGVKGIDVYLTAKTTNVVYDLLNP